MHLCRGKDQEEGIVRILLCSLRQLMIVERKHLFYKQLARVSLTTVLLLTTSRYFHLPTLTQSH